MKKMKDRQICLQKRKKKIKKYSSSPAKFTLYHKFWVKKVLLVQPNREVKY